MKRKGASDDAALTSSLRPELLEKIQQWLISFHRLDPRYKILTFFNQVAAEGADQIMEDDDADTDYPTSAPLVSAASELLSIGAQKLLSDAFNATSILTVWRPCSNDAMRKMMEGSGVGKGLDIKGKSAKQGLLSALVPYLQIHDAVDKYLIQPIPLGAKIRVYYTSGQARQVVMETLSKYAKDEAPTEEEIIPSKLKVIDKYARKSLFGLELSQRLFWKGYVLEQDISRSKEYDTGRPSTPGFQDANNKTLKMALKQQPEPSPMPVVFQYNGILTEQQQRQQQQEEENDHSDNNNDNNNNDNINYSVDPMQPQTLVMAYEENGTVTPVVSDFDGFLLGWRREALWFGCNLPREQEELMMWCIKHIEAILDARPTTDTWTVRWLEVLKQEASSGFIPEIPPYGFGDPKSYAIMEEAANRLIDTGAVRHGSECFNYYFPQEIDDMFLIISDTLSPVPWKYVNVQELQALLSDKIAEGFVFPLNPKWILCDPGWKKLYDELMASEALYADMSKDVWYPPFLGVRDKIEEIHKRHPNGFQQRRGRVSFEAKQGYSPLRQNLEKGVAMSGNAAFDLAELELENYTSRKNTLARQIQLASLEEIPDKHFDTNTGMDDDDSTRDGSTSGRQLSKRSMFRLQRTDGANGAAPGGSGSNTPKGSSNNSIGTSASSVAGPDAILMSPGGGSGVLPESSLRDGSMRTSLRSLFPSMHSAVNEPRRNFGRILAIDADLADSEEFGEEQVPKDT